MAQETILDLPLAGPLAGTESVPIVQNGVTVQTTTSAIAGAGALNYSFLTVGQTAGLTQSRYLSTNSGLTLTDNGIQNALQINLIGSAMSLNSSGNGIQVKSGPNTVTARSLAVGGGLTISNADGVSGNPTISFDTTISNFASLTGTGMLVMQGGIPTKVSILGTTNQISIANGDGSANVTASISSNATLPGTGSVIVPKGTTAQRSIPPENGMFRYNTELGVFEGYLNGVWGPVATGGGVQSVGTGTGLLGGPITSTGTISVDTAVVATLSGAQTLTGKTISGLSNTLSDIGNSSLTNSSITINGSSVSLGGSTTVTATASNPLTIGAGLTGGTYNGSSSVTVLITDTGVTAGTYGSASSVPVIAVNSRGQSTSASSTNIAISASQVTSGIFPVSQGGTNISSYSVGDMLYASGSTALSKLGVGTQGQVMVAGATGPTWGSVAGGSF